MGVLGGDFLVWGEWLFQDYCATRVYMENDLKIKAQCFSSCMKHLMHENSFYLTSYCRGLGFLMSFWAFFGDFSADFGFFRPPGPRKSSPPCDFTSIGGRRAPEDDI